MARVTIIDIPDHQVDAVLSALQTLANGPAATPPPIVEIPQALPAPAPEEADLEAAAEAAPVRHVNRQRRQQKAARQPKAQATPKAKPKPLGVGARILAALPGGVGKICQRTGLTPRQVRGNLYLLVKAGKAVREGDTWRVPKPGEALSPPGPAGKRGRKSADEEQPAQPLRTTAQVFLDALAHGELSSHQLLHEAQAAGKAVPDVHHAERILIQMARRGEIERTPAGRWTRKGATA